MSKVDIEEFLKKWWSEESLEYRHDIREWMQNSYKNPFSFWEELFSYAKDRSEAISQTILFEKYDFYSDCIIRHLGSSLTALKVIKTAGEVETWSYDQVHALVEAQAAFWIENYAPKPGQTAVLLLPYGIDFIVALMTSLRLGLQISILPLLDRFFSRVLIQQGLDQIKPDLVITTQEVQISEKWNPIHLDLTLEKVSSQPPSSHAYLASETVQKLFNPFEANDKITTIEATRSYLAPLRDATTALNLKEGRSWARPFGSLYLEEPFLTLAAFLSGATIVYISDEALLSNPQALKAQSIDLLGVSPFLQELWLKSPGAPSCKQWYRNSLYGNDQSWKAFSELNQLQKVPVCQMIMDREKSGIILYSQPKPQLVVSFMHPSLGAPWKLLKLGKKEVESIEGFGLFLVEPMASHEPYLVTAQVGDEWIVSISTLPLREGYPYPINAVEESVKTLDFVSSCMIVPEKHPHHFINKQFTLLVFVSPDEYHFIAQKTNDWTHQMISTIQAQVGSAYVPDQIHYFSLIPKLDKGELHRQWVESQYESGALFAKQKRTIYHSLNLFRQSIYEKISYHVGS